MVDRFETEVEAALAAVESAPATAVQKTEMLVEFAMSRAVRLAARI